MAWNKTLTDVTYRLADLYFDSGDARLVAIKAGLDVGGFEFDRTPRNYWQNILMHANSIDDGARNHTLIIDLLETITSPNERGAIDGLLKTTLNDYKTGQIPDGRGLSISADWRKYVLTDECFILDRDSVYEKLVLLAKENADEKVILIRGGKKSGKSWSHHLFKEVAKQVGAGFTHIEAGPVTDAQDTIDELFGHFNRIDDVPEKDTSPEAWYKKVCLKLKEIAATTGKPLWIAMDNLGEDELPEDVRQFFNQFVLKMGNQNFNQWFRLILINYPYPEKIPTNWKAKLWTTTNEPFDEKDVQVQHVADCLSAWIESENRPLLPDDLKNRSEKLIIAIDSYQSEQDTEQGKKPKPRLERIQDALIQTITELKAQTL